MRKTIYLLAAAAVALTIAGAGCANKNAEKQPVAEQKAATSEDFSGTMSDLMKRGKPVHCTYSMTADNVTQSGELFVDGTRARSDINMNIAGIGPKTTHAIALGDDQYVWGMQEGKGTKITMSIDEQKKLAEQSKTAYDKNSQGAPDINTKIDFKCNSWSVDASKFEVPKDIQFQDLTSMLKNLQVVGTATPDSGTKVVDMCKVCNSIPAGAAKDACIKASCK